MILKRVTKPSMAWIAALFLGLMITGCGGGGTSKSDGSPASEQRSQPSDPVGQQTTAGSASLSWNAPFKRVNGETLAMGELSGYVIRYGQNPEELSETVRIGRASTMEYTIKNLGAGTWYFTVQVQDVNGVMSAPSAQVSKTI